MGIWVLRSLEYKISTSTNIHAIPRFIKCHVNKYPRADGLIKYHVNKYPRADGLTKYHVNKYPRMGYVRMHI